MTEVTNPVAVTTTGVVTTADIFISLIRWVAGASSVAGEACTVTDNNGTVFFSSTSTGANFIDANRFDTTLPVRGINVTSLPHGTLYIYFR